MPGLLAIARDPGGGGDLRKERSMILQSQDYSLSLVILSWGVIQTTKEVTASGSLTFVFHKPYKNKFLTVHKKQKARTFVLTFCLSVGVAGFEPATPCSQSRCASRAALYPVGVFQAAKIGKVLNKTKDKWKKIKEKL